MQGDGVRYPLGFLVFAGNVGLVGGFQGLLDKVLPPSPTCPWESARLNLTLLSERGLARSQLHSKTD